MKAIILAGGLGQRLRPLTFSIPKPLLPVGEKPILQIIIEQLHESSISEIVLATGYQAELIEAFCGDGSRFGVSIRYVRESEPLGTAGPLSLVRHCFGEDEIFLLMNGDIFTGLRSADFMQAARVNGCDLTVGFTEYVYRSPFGVLQIDDGAVTGIVEKPEQQYAISAGIYAVRSSALPFIPDGFFTMPQLIEKLSAAGKRVAAYHIREEWLGLESIVHFDEAVKRVETAQPNGVKRSAGAS
jgi:NDP-sugar pyrophosphorylase family protein